MFSFLVLQKDNSLYGRFCRISSNLLDTKTVSSHSFCQIWCTYLAVKDLGPKKAGDRLLVFCQELFSQLYQQPRFLEYQHVQEPTKKKKKKSVWSALILCHSFFFKICISKGWSVFNFPITCKADSESEKKKRISFLEIDRLVWEQTELIPAPLCK